jgi:hypothetical protein
MDLRFPPVFLIGLLIFLSAIAGCISSTPPQGAAILTYETIPAETIHAVETGKAAHTITNSPKESIADQLSTVKSDNPVWREAYRMFKNIRTTEYVHPPYIVDDAAGVYKFDCLGFVDHVLMGADIASYKEIGKNVNPSIESYAAYFNKLDSKTPNALGWTRVAHPSELKPGDVCLWLKPTTLDTGHIWIIAGEPAVNPKRNNEVLVRIFDSSEAHSDDSRTGPAFKTGLGSGIIGMMVDGKGNPVGLYWDGGVSTSAGEKDTTIVCGRLNR